jgi:hypothetical protein
VPFFVICPEAFTRNTAPDEVEVLVLELELDELLLDEELLELDDELLDELLLELDDELLLDEEEELLEELELPLIEPAEAVSVTRSSLDPSSRRTMRSVCVPADRLLKVVSVSVEYPLVCWLFCVTQEPASIR